MVRVAVGPSPPPGSTEPPHAESARARSDESARPASRRCGVRTRLAVYRAARFAPLVRRRDNVRVRLVSRRALLAYPIAASLATRVARADVATPLRARYMPGADLYAPASALEANRAYDLLVHFHGEPAWVEPPVERARLGAVVVTVNLGEGSGVFEAAFKSPRALDALLASTQRAIDASGRAPGARLGRIALSGWSAGFGAVGAVLAQPELAERIDAVLLQ